VSSSKKQIIKKWEKTWGKKLSVTFLLGSIFNSCLPAITQTVIAQEAENQTPKIPIVNQASYTYTDNNNNFFAGATTQLQASSTLVDPLGRILGCGGQILPDYSGFSVSLYEPLANDPTGTQIGNLVDLTRTEVPDISGNNIPGGKNPNSENRNPYFVGNNPAGVYNFLFDPDKGQLTPGKTYILVVNPPSGSIFQQRRIKIRIIESQGTEGITNNVVRYIASSLDGQPITVRGETTVTDSVVLVPNAETVGLDLLAFEFTTNLCQPNQVQIVKSSDRASAEPGDIPIYRLSVKNLADVPLNSITVTDTLPLGFNFVSKSVRGEVNGQSVNVTAKREGSVITFNTDSLIPSGSVLNIAYAAQLTSDSVRGSGKNLASVTATRSDNRFQTKDGPASHQLKIRPGIVSDCGTIIGRVFVDKNFDGEQQENEPGIPNAVVFMEDGNRITTDPNGLFSVANVLPGSHTGALDLSSLPGYTIAPNIKFSERNSHSRLVRLQPGGMVRMNFAVTPTFQEEVKK
jgi:uncharacterized repeat protein (TIGR01451 family)